MVSVPASIEVMVFFEAARIKTMYLSVESLFKASAHTSDGAVLKILAMCSVGFLLDSPVTGEDIPFICSCAWLGNF